MPKYVQYAHAGRVSFGRLTDDTIYPLTGTIGSFDETTRNPVALSDVTLLPPSTPTKIVSIGPNFGCRYTDGTTPPDRPHIWLKPSSALNGPNGIIEVPANHTINHEAELAVVIGRTAKCVPADQAANYIFGYTCMNDITAGDFSVPGRFAASHFFVDGKSFDTFAPIGPCINTDLDYSNLHLQCRVNGETRQSHTTADFLFSPPVAVALVSEVMTLFPGDIVSLGSPPGVGPLNIGDTVEIEIDNIGILRNHVQAR